MQTNPSNELTTSKPTNNPTLLPSKSNPTAMRFISTAPTSSSPTSAVPTTSIPTMVSSTDTPITAIPTKDVTSTSIPTTKTTVNTNKYDITYKLTIYPTKTTSSSPTFNTAPPTSNTEPPSTINTNPTPNIAASNISAPTYNITNIVHPTPMPTPNPTSRPISRTLSPIFNNVSPTNIPTLLSTYNPSSTPTNNRFATAINIATSAPTPNPTVNPAIYPTLNPTSYPSITATIKPTKDGIDVVTPYPTTYPIIIDDNDENPKLSIVLGFDKFDISWLIFIIILILICIVWCCFITMYIKKRCYDDRSINQMVVIVAPHKALKVKWNEDGYDEDESDENIAIQMTRNNMDNDNMDNDNMDNMETMYKETRMENVSELIKFHHPVILDERMDESQTYPTLNTLRDGQEGTEKSADFISIIKPSLDRVEQEFINKMLMEIDESDSLHLSDLDLSAYHRYHKPSTNTSTNTSSITSTSL